jgi:hypothetical protein
VIVYDPRKVNGPKAARKSIARPKATRTTGPRAESKTALFLAAVVDKYGPLAALDVRRVSPISAELAPTVGLHPGAGRAALGKAVKAAQS